MGPRGQEPNESTDDAVWQDLVARLEGTAAAPDAPAAPHGSHAGPSGGTALPRQDEPTPRRHDDGGQVHDPSGSGEFGPTDRERVDAIFHNQPFGPGGPRDYSAPDGPDDDSGFTPKDPPPLGSGNPLTVLAWIGAAGGPVLLLLFAMFWRDAPLAATLGVLALFLAGAGYLVTKLPKHRDIGDDGAEV